MTAQGGPYVQAACFCDLVLEDKSGSLSLVRIIDKLTHVAQGPNPPDQMPPVPYLLKLALMLKNGQARGRHNLRVVPELPSGETEDPLTLTAHFEGDDDNGQNAVINLAFTFKLEGLHWFKVYLDDQFLTALPFRMKYNRLVTGPVVHS